jgi:3'(2'), 5'-bisphosphate nucleotidase
MLLFEETGGKITDVFGRDIDVGVGRLMEANFGFVASLPGLHQAVLEATHRTLREFGRVEVLREGGLLE